MGLIKLGLLLPSYSDIKQKFENLLGNENIEISTNNKEREKKSKNILENEVLESEIELLAQGGIPGGDRVEIYFKYFGIENNMTKVNNFIDFCTEIYINLKYFFK